MQLIHALAICWYQNKSYSSLQRPVYFIFLLLWSSWCNTFMWLLLDFKWNTAKPEPKTENSKSHHSARCKPPFSSRRNNLRHTVHIKKWSRLRPSGARGVPSPNISYLYCFVLNDFPCRQSQLLLTLSSSFRIKSNPAVGQLIIYWCPSVSSLLPRQSHKGSHLFHLSGKVCFLLYSLTSGRAESQGH